MTTSFYMPTVTTHREKGTGITRVAVDGITDAYFSVEKRGKLFYVRMHDETNPDDCPGWSCGYDTQHEALAECVERIIRDRRIDAEHIDTAAPVASSSPQPEPQPATYTAPTSMRCHSCGHDIKPGGIAYDGYGQPWHRGCWLETYDGSESTLDYYR